MTHDLVAVGETLIDLITRDFVPSLQFAGQFSSHLGGEPVNVAANMARLGGTSSVLTKVGADGLGAFATQQMQLAGLNTDLVVVDPARPTSVALVTRSVATPDFVIHRGADAHLTIDELPDVIDSRWVHTSAFALSRSPLRETVIEVVSRARRAGSMVSLDPNYHARVWNGAPPHEVLAAVLPMVDVVKASEDDCRRVFGAQATPRHCIEQWLAAGVKCVIVTQGSGPVVFSTDDGVETLPIPEVEVRDVTGAGDAFWAGFIAATLRDAEPGLAIAAGVAVAGRAVQAVGPFTRDLDLDEVLAEAKELWGSRRGSGTASSLDVGAS